MGLVSNWRLMRWEWQKVSKPEVSGKKFKAFIGRV